MSTRATKCARNITAITVVICLIVTAIPLQMLNAQDDPVNPKGNPYAIFGFSDLGVGSVQDSPENGASAIGAGVRSWIYSRSNEIAVEAEIDGSYTPSGIGQTTDYVDDGSGSVGRSVVDHGFSIDCAGFTSWVIGDQLVIEIALNSTDGGYSSACDMVLNGGDYFIGNLPTNGGLVPMHKIGGAFGTGISGVDYFNVTRTTPTTSILAWPDQSDEWGNIYGYRVFRNSTSEPWHPIFNLTFGNATTGYTDTACLPGIGYNYSIGLLYRGMQAAVQNNNTVVPSLYRSYPVASMPLLQVTPTPADGAMGQGISTPYSLMFSRTMNTGVGSVSIAPAPVANGAWAWDPSGVWYNYTGATWAELTKYYLNLTGFIDLSGNSLSGDSQFIFTVGDFTAPASNVTGPATANTLAFINLAYTFNDPSGVSQIEIWYTWDFGTSWASQGIDNTPNGSFEVFLPMDGTYGWYTAAIDSLGNGEVTPPVGPGFIEFMTLVDTVDPLIGPTTVDKLFINNQGTYGGTPPPVNVTTSVSDSNLAVAGWGIRNENLVGNSTLYFRNDITNDIMPSTQPWDGNWYFINGTLVTADASPDIFGQDVLVMGEVNGTSSTGTVLGNIMPVHYALFDGISGNLQSVYCTNSTPGYTDDYPVTVGPAGSFRAYRYDEGFGYIATALDYSGPDFDFGWGWMALTILPIVDGRYTVCVTAVDWAQNSNWTNEADGNPVITVDTVAPEVSLTVPADAATGVALNQDIAITFSEAVDNATVTYTVNPNPGGLVGAWSGGNTVLTISHNAFSELTAYTVTVTAARDTTGNNLIPGAVPNPWTFTTGEFTPPYVTFTSPANNTVDVSTAAGTYEVQFSEPMNTGISGVLTNLPGAVGSWDGAGTWFNITHIGLAEFTQYYVNFTGQGHEDLAGNALAVPRIFFFRTVDLTDPMIDAGSNEVKNALFFTADAAQRATPASASDLGSGIANYTWSVNTGPGFITWSDQWALNTSVLPDTEGTYTIDLTVTDNSGNSFTDSFMLVWDITNPTSTVDAVSPYWQTSPPLTITVTANDGISGLANVELWYRHSADNSTWGAWANFGTDNAAPWSWSFTFPSGNGYYEFYSRARDNATNYETAPVSADAVCGYDNVFPTSSVDAITPYWFNTAPIILTATAVQATASISNVEFWYRYSADNASWGAWTMFDNDTAAPWSAGFGFPDGNGYYEFYSRALDLAGKYEAAPGAADALCGNDTMEPIWSTVPISTYWQTASPMTVTTIAGDPLSGVAFVELYYRFALDNATWGAWASFGTDAAAPYQFSFNFPDGNGYYGFYTNATDVAGNEGFILVISGMLCAFDNTAPVSAVDSISPYWQTAIPLTITATASDALSGVANVELWYRYAADNATWGVWTLFGTDNAAPWSWSFNFPGGDGHYQFYTRARDVAGNYEAAPGAGDALCALDTGSPSSNVNAIGTYWQTASPLTITATANDAMSGLAGIELWYRYSTNNATWGGWINFGTDNAAPWSWSFNFPDGNGYYEFYSRATDMAGLYEAAPGARDALCSFDSAAPTSSVNALNPYWRTGSPIAVTATASDVTDGVATVELWYRFSADNATWGAWINFGTDNAAPWSWSFNFLLGNGYYEFYSRATDTAGNYENAPGTRDTLCAFDDTAPASSADAISPYWQTVNPVTVTASVNDALSGVVSVELWFRYAVDNATWGAWTNFGTDNAAPWSWSFNFPLGNGYYQFYSRAHDLPGNYEAAPGTRDALCGYDSISPASSASAIAPYWYTAPPVTITATATDGISGVANVQLWFRYSTDNATWGAWANFGTDNAAPWSWSFTFPSGNGYYEFYTRATDRAGNYELAPVSRDALTAYDSVNPTITVTVPADTESDVAFGQDIVITFDEPMDTGTVAYTVTPNPGGLVEVWNANNTVLTISHTPFAGSMNYFVNVIAGQDKAGNTIAAGSAQNPWSFTTMVAMTVDYIQIETLAMGGTVVNEHTMTIDETFTVWAIGYNAMGGAVGPVQVNWTTTGTLDVRTSVLTTSFTFNPASAIRYGTIRATYGLFTINTGLITVNPGVPVSFNINPAGAAITADQTLQFSASGQDAMGNPTGPVAVTWSLTHATMVPNTANGSISASGLFTPGLVAVWTLTAVHATLGTETTTVTVTAGTLAGIIVSPAYAQADAGEDVAFSIDGFDAKGNAITSMVGPTLWFLDGEIQASGIISSTLAGNHTVFASHGGFLGIAYLDVSAAAGNRLVIGQTVSSITADQTCTFTVSMLDAYGNPVYGPLPTIIWRAGNGTIANGLFRPWTSGQIRIWANATGYIGGIAFINVTAGTVTRIVISSGGTGTRDTTVVTGQSMLFSVSALDQRDNLVSVPTAFLSWATTVGTVSNGFFTAITGLNGAQSLVGLLTVTYTSGTTQIIGTENITVNVGPLHHITIDSTDEVPLNEYQTYTAQGYDLYNNVITGLSFIWATTGNVGEIGSDGVFRGTDRGMGAVTATSGGITGSIPVFVSTPAGIFASWLWLVIILFIVVIILAIFLILGRRREVVFVGEPEETEEETEEPEEISPEYVPEELDEPLDDLEEELDTMAEPALEPEAMPREGPKITTAEVKSLIAEEMRVERCEKMLSASVVLPDDKEKLQSMIASGISPENFAEEIQKAIERRKKRELEKDVTANEKAAILEDELVAELAELEDNLENGAKEQDLEDQILKEIEDLEDM